MRLAPLILGLALVLGPEAGLSAPPDFQSRLEEADAIRSADPAAFVRALDALDARIDEADTRQRQHLQLLHAYREAFKGDFDGAVALARQLHAEARDPEVKLRSSLLIANSAAATRNFALGLSHLEQSLAATGAADADPRLREQALAVATILYNQFSKYELSRQYADQLIASTTDPRTRCIARQQRLSALRGLGSWPADPAEVQEALAGCEAIGEKVFVSFIRIEMARHMAATGDRDGAEKLLSRHLREAEAAGYARLISEFRSLLAGYRLEKDDLANARKLARSALDIDADSSASLPKVEALEVLYRVAEREGNLPAALDYYRQYAQADKTYLDDVMVRELAFQQSRNEVQQKDQAIALLSKQNQVLKLEQEVARTSAQNTRLLLLLLAVVLAAIGYWAYKIKRVQTRFRILAQTDGLTGIANRRHFRSQAEALLADCEAAGRSAALVLLDLDNFKHINDQHGHAAGDWVLKQVADACHAACREGDLCGRLGGEEFGILSCGADGDAAEAIAQRCRERLAAIDTGLIHHAMPITASFGCTTTAVSGHAFETMFAHADEAMYLAKNSGRDQVRTHAVRTGDGGSRPAITA
ncbi:GGDEF domain-containing protein [Marilutibacter spongiae]|uniref:diguanylate cyclase n=1 Tax=Marilutibacter spongiae TaxID=2025720 RepID=A0A7W3TKH8_9GAMM|nr:GGDEF domain-containing protein [Lysobacter spongiae]MBB1059978.1 diguanylate cyclase [Lysobacter spongiae]